MRSPDYLAALDLLSALEGTYADRERLRQAGRATRSPVLAVAIETSAEACLTEGRRLVGELVAALRSARAEEDAGRLVVVAYDDRGVSP